ncbi:DsrE family protein [Rhizohabitans arisaemae]|uniref:DsrE family protein n=1 Tax=Rhizohabitans arisaemae TaxID=2720610 RepID=UPI0024B1125D|nr:DsrE family protein [Rhizohabitans arisaemae]
MRGSVVGPRTRLRGRAAWPARDLAVFTAQASDIGYGPRRRTGKEKYVMAGKAVISLTTGLEDTERVTVAFLVAVAAAEEGRPTLMFLTKEAARLALEGVAVAVACHGCPPLADLVDRYAKAGGSYLVCPICFDSRKLDKSLLIDGAELGGTVPMWKWIGDEGATTFSY